MIFQWNLGLARPSGEAIPHFWAYRLYAWLLTQLPEKIAEQLHDQEAQSVSQHLDQNIWTVNLLGEEAFDCFDRVLGEVTEINLHADQILITECRKHTVKSPEEFLQSGRGILSKKAEILFVSPTSFKQAGRYAVFPQEALLLQSLLTRWNQYSSFYLLQDEELVEELKRGIHIVDYSLRTGRFRLKDSAIPGFYGKVIIEARLPLVLQEIWNALLCFAPYSGIGIKTTLGMGGVETAFLNKAKKQIV